MSYLVYRRLRPAANHYSLTTIHYIRLKRCGMKIRQSEEVLRSLVNYAFGNRITINEQKNN